MKAFYFITVGILGWWLTSSVSCLAEADAEAPSTSSKSPDVVALTESVLESVAVVIHHGRDGRIDGTGAGFIVSEDGLIATCAHVIGEARPIEVELRDGSKHEVVSVHAWDHTLDLALIRIAQTGLTPLPLGDSDQLKPGADIIALGNPQGVGISVVRGLVSAVRRLENREMIQLAIPIEPGNSGGPLLDMDGTVQGILNMKSLITDNLGFAIPVNSLKLLLDRPNPVKMDRWLRIGALSKDKWHIVFGAHWSKKSGVISVDGAGRSFGGRALCLSTRTPSGYPFEITVKTKLNDEAGAAGIAFASDGQDRHYGFYPSGGRIRLTHFGGPEVWSWTILEEIETPHYLPGEWNRLRVKVTEDRMVCFVNGHPLVEMPLPETDFKYHGLVKFRDTVASFKDFRMGRELGIEGQESASPRLDGLEDLISKAPPSEPLLDHDLFLSHPEQSRRWLLSRAKGLEREAERIRQLALEVHQQSVRRELAGLFETDDDSDVDLFQAAMLVAKHDDTELDIAVYEHEISIFAERIQSYLTPESNLDEKRRALDRFLFEENGYHGSRVDYYDRANSYLNRVIDDREGIPITLSVLYMELASRIGLPGVVGIPLPGHFVVQIRDEEGRGPWIDVFNGAVNLDRKAVDKLVVDATQSVMNESYLVPSTRKEIILRMLRNLIGIARASPEPKRALPYLELSLAIDPESHWSHFTRGQLHFEGGDMEAARKDFDWLMKNSPPGSPWEGPESRLSQP